MIHPQQELDRKAILMVRVNRLITNLGVDPPWTVNSMYHYTHTRGSTSYQHQLLEQCLPPDKATLNYWGIQLDKCVYKNWRPLMNLK